MNITQGYWALFCVIYIISAGLLFLGLLTPDRKRKQFQKGWFQFDEKLGQVCFVGLFITLILLWNTVSAYCYGSQPNSYLQSALEYMTVPRSATNTDATSVILALVLVFAQLSRVWYENVWTSTPSRATYSLPLVLFSYLHYPAILLAIMADAPALQQVEGCLSMSHLKWRHLAAVLVFIWASRVQHKALKALARLRKNRAGHIVTSAYKMPVGGWFEAVSCPHYFAELVIYASIGIVLQFQGTTFGLYLIYLLCQHSVKAYNTHKWYQKTFKDYPKDRKALVPYIF